VLDVLGWLLNAIWALPVLAFLLYAPGAVVLNSLLSRGPARHLFAGVDEWLFTAVLVSFLTTGLVCFIMAEVGLFRWWIIVPIVLVFCVLVGLLLGQVPLRPRSLLALLKVPSPYPQRATDRRQSRIQQGLLVALIVLGAVLFSRPSEMLRGALDSGAYVNAGVAMARSGSILQQDTLMRQLNSDTGEVKELMLGLNPDRYVLDNLRMPAFYVLDKKASLVLPQHYNLYPAWIALGYSLFGIWGALYITPLLALLAVLAFYYFARRTIGDWAALAALLLLILCPVTIWFARYPVSEVITGLLAFGAFFAFLRFQLIVNSYELRVDDRSETTINSQPVTINSPEAPDRWASFWAVIAGVSLGQIALARPDFIFFLAPVPFYLVYWRLSRRWQRPHTWFAVSLGAIMLLYAVHFAFYSYVYTLDLYFNVIQIVRRMWGPLLLGLYAVVFLLIALDRLYPRLKPIWVRVDSWVVRYRWAWAGAIIVVLAAYFSYKYFYAPWQPNIRVDSAGRPIAQQISTHLDSYIGAPVDEGARYNLLRVGWYLSPIGMVVGVLGLLRWVWDRLSAATGLFFGSLLVVGLVFIQETYTEAFYIYSMRRYVPVILPALILGFAWAAHFLWTRVKPRPLGFALAGILIAGLAVFFAYTDRVIVPHVEERGAVAQLDDLAGRLGGGKSVVLFSDGRDEPYVVATPLQYIYGIESFVLAHNFPQVNNTVLQQVIQRWQSQGYKVWVMMGANGGQLNLPGYSLKQEGTWDYDVPEFEQLTTQKPTNVSNAFLPWGIYSIEPTQAAPQWPFKLDIGDNDYQYLVTGFNKQERDNPSSPYWRWTGPQSILRVPWPTQAGSSKTYDGGTVTLRLRPESPVPGKPALRTEPLTVTVTLDNTPVGTIIVPPGSDFTDYTLHVPPGIAKVGTDPDNALLGIKSPTWSPYDAGVSNDQRALGVQMDGVDIGR
jgi:4-amino-4-deoxy-L-arabinose transferase-like glycosyltransferase